MVPAFSRDFGEQVPGDRNVLWNTMICGIPEQNAGMLLRSIQLSSHKRQLGRGSLVSQTEVSPAVIELPFGHSFRGIERLAGFRKFSGGDVIVDQVDQRV